jgi:predicted lipoprotein with Yx(FWY)xxD motif
MALRSGMEDQVIHRIRLLAGALVLAAGLAACSNGSAPAGGPTILAQTVGTNSTLLVAGSNGMTVYAFDKDVANNGTSACTATDDCIATWPALTVPTGTTPTAGAGVTGKIGTITRADSGALQVTYNGVPLYFYSGDQAVGDSNGIYTDWNAIKP